MSWDNCEKLLKTVKFVSYYYLVSNPQTDCEYDTMKGGYFLGALYFQFKPSNVTVCICCYFFWGLMGGRLQSAEWSQCGSEGEALKGHTISVSHLLVQKQGWRSLLFLWNICWVRLRYPRRGTCLQSNHAEEQELWTPSIHDDKADSLTIFSILRAQTTTLADRSPPAPPPNSHFPT